MYVLASTLWLPALSPCIYLLREERRRREGEAGRRKCTQKPESQVHRAASAATAARGCVAVCTRSTDVNEWTRRTRGTAHAEAACARYIPLYYFALPSYVRGRETPHGLFATGHIITSMYSQPSPPLLRHIYPREITTLECTRTPAHHTHLFFSLLFHHYLHPSFPASLAN